MKPNKKSLDSLLLLENQICFPFYAASRLIVQAYGPFLNEMGITYPQFLVLMVLWEKDSQSLKEIGALLYLDSGTLTPVMQKLFTGGFIQRVRNPKDERIVYNRLTPKGKRLKARAAEMSYSLFCSSGLGVQQVQDLRASVNGLLSKLTQVRIKKSTGSRPRSSPRK